MAEGPGFPSAEVVAFSEEVAGAAALGKCSLVSAATSAVAAPVWVQVSRPRVSGVGVCC